MHERDHTARIPLETKLEILRYLTRCDLLGLNAVSRTWRAAAWLDPRLFVYACACLGTVKSERLALSTAPNTLAVCSLDEALEFQLRIAIEFCSYRLDCKFCLCARPQTDWATFSQSFQPFSRLIRSLRVVAYDVPRGGLFDHTLTALHALTLKNLHRPDDIAQSLPQWLTPGAAPLLSSLDLYGFHPRAPAGPFISITTLSLSYKCCRLPKDKGEPISLALTFPRLRHLTLCGHPQLLDAECAFILKERWIDWRGIEAKLQLLDLDLGCSCECGSSFLPDEMLGAPLLTRETIRDAEEDASFFMSTLVSESTAIGYTDVKMVYLYDPGDTSQVVLAAQEAPRGESKLLRTRILNLKATYWYDWDEDDCPHHGLAAYLTSLTLPLQVFYCNPALSTIFPVLRELTLLFDGDAERLPDDNDSDSDEESADDGEEPFEPAWMCRQIDCASTLHKHKQRTNPPFPQLTSLAFVGIKIARQVHTRVLASIVRDMGVFMRRPPSMTRPTVELRGIEVPDLDPNHRLWEIMGEVAYDVDATFDPTELIATLQAKDEEWADVRL